MSEVKQVIPIGEMVRNRVQSWEKFDTLSDIEKERLISLESRAEEHRRKTLESPIIALGSDYGEYRVLWEKATGKKRKIAAGWLT